MECLLGPAAGPHQLGAQNVRRQQHAPINRGAFPGGKPFSRANRNCVARFPQFG